MNGYDIRLGPLDDADGVLSLVAGGVLSSWGRRASPFGVAGVMGPPAEIGVVKVDARLLVGDLLCNNVNPLGMGTPRPLFVGSPVTDDGGAVMGCPPTIGPKLTDSRLGAPLVRITGDVGEA